MRHPVASITSMMSVTSPLALGPGRSALVDHVHTAISGITGEATGFGVHVETGGGRLTVTPGLAVDPHGRPIREPRPRATTENERFLRRADDAVAQARRTDAALTSAIESVVTSHLVSDFLPFLANTSADGRRFCTVWGADPLFVGEALPRGPYTHQFPLRTAAWINKPPDDPNSTDAINN